MARTPKCEACLRRRERFKLRIKPWGSRELAASPVQDWRLCGPCAAELYFSPRRKQIKAVWDLDDERPRHGRK